jgi:bifunctional non-homologous end joining protein LigD
VPTVDPRTVKPGRWAKAHRGPEHWVKPEVVAEVSFTEWTPDGHVRHPSFVALRSDKPASQITREAEKGNEMPPAPPK